MLRLQHHHRNNLLARLPAEDYALLAEDLESWSGRPGTIFIKANTPAPFVYFPESGIISIVARASNGQQAEVGLIGREGFVHPVLVLGSDHLPWDAQVQIPGDCFRIPRQRFLDIMDASTNLQRTMLLFAQTLFIQSCSTTMSNALFLTEQRLARWLLMCHDRGDCDELFLTHEFVATMLSVRRPSTTNALHVLEGHGLIRSERGCVKIRDRAALERYAGDAYGKPEAEYRELLHSAEHVCDA